MVISTKTLPYQKPSALLPQEDQLGDILRQAIKVCVRVKH